MRRYILFFHVLILFTGLAYSAARTSNNYGSKKPPEGIGVNWGDDITRKLVVFLPFNNVGKTVDLVFGYRSIINNLNPLQTAGNFSGPASLFVSSDRRQFFMEKSPVLSSSYTVCFWFLANSLSLSGEDIARFGNKGAVTNGCYFEILTNAPGYRILVTPDSGAGNSIIGGTLSTTTWHCVVITKQANILTLYINSIEIGTHTGTDGTITANQLAIGSGSASPSVNAWLDGKIDMFFIWDRILNQNEISRIYNDPMCLFSPQHMHFQTLTHTISNIMKTFGQIF